MFGTTYESSPRRSDWEKYYGDPYGSMGMREGREMYGDEYYWHKREKERKKLAKMDKKERKKYMKKHKFTPETYETHYYKPYYETEGFHHRKGEREMEMYSPKHERYGEKYHMQHRMRGKDYEMAGQLEWKRDKQGRKKWKTICDMGESDKFWLVRAEMPGVRKEKLRVEMEGKDLIIIGKKKKECWHMDKLMKHKGKKHEGEKKKVRRKKDYLRRKKASEKKELRRRRKRRWKTLLEVSSGGERREV
jgi:HSP20 family molecular chaperone IbpA